MLKATLTPLQTTGAQVQAIGTNGWRLGLPPGPAGQYRVAQLDDYGRLRRGEFPHSAPLSLSLKARASSAEIPGTWGFGLWNNPFSLAVLTGVEILRLPALPNAAWFFFASPPNYLSLRDDLPGRGARAAAFRSAPLPAGLLALAAPALPLLFWSATAGWLRRLARRYVQEEAVSLRLDPTSWHRYRLDWQAEKLKFWIDEAVVLATEIVPHGPLGLVLWVDNQYAALPPGRRLSMGALAHEEEAWIDLDEVEIVSG